MPSRFLSHLFEPFTRNRNTEHVEGSGLGLSITKGLIELMGGELCGEPGTAGTTFRVEMEYRIAPEDNRGESGDKTGVSTPSGADRLTGRCLLVAEDNEINAEVQRAVIVTGCKNCCENKRRPGAERIPERGLRHL